MRYVSLLIVMVVFSISAKAAVFTVTNNNNEGTGSLREAILNANANGIIAIDYIYFNINASSVADITINLTNELPQLTSNIIIDASTQPTSFLGSASIKIRLVRNSSSFFSGLSLNGVFDVEIYGIYFSNFLSEEGGPADERRAGIFLNNTERITIGKPNKSNGFGNNYTSIISPTVSNFQRQITISSNIIGLDPTGQSAMPNVVGIDLSYISNSTIGGQSEEYGNLISANINGVSLGAISGDVNISFNVIGLDITKTRSFPATRSIGILANAETVNLSINDNYIVSQFTGVKLVGIRNKYKISHNYIGVGPNSTNFGNTKYGIELYGCGAGVVGGQNLSDQNIMAYNEQAIQIDLSYPVSILKNSIYCNTKYAIGFKELPNGKFITPSSINVISSNFASGTYLPNSTVELFIDDECPDCQGKTWIATIATNSDGQWVYNGPFSGGLTSTGTNPEGATSGFSKPMISDLDIKKVDVYCGSSNGSIINLKITDASVFEWYNSNNELVGQTQELINVPAGFYYLKAGQPGGCKVVSPNYEIKNIVLTFKVKSFDINKANCNLNNGSILIKSYETASPVEFIWTNDLGTVVSRTQKLDGMPPGNYTLTVSSGNGCSNIAGVFNIGIASKPAVDLSQMKALISCDGKLISVQNINILGESEPYSYQWRDEKESLVYKNLLLQSVSPGKYRLFVKDIYGCEINTDLLDFSGLKEQVLEVPSSISPNGDGVNDTWKIIGSENYPQGIFTVFNRNGNKVYFSVGYKKEFDGTYNGKYLSTGVYYYTIDLKNNCGILSGALTIIR